MEVIAKLGSLLGLSFICGINLYATIAVVGICSKYQLVQGLPPEFHILANDAVIFVAILLYIVEFLVDKIPGLDTLWDSIHTLIRPLGGAMIALIQVGNASPAMEVIVFMLGASLASVAHITKAGTRLMINTSPEPFSNILVSLLEDAWAIGFSYLTLAHPTLGFFITIVCLAIIGLTMPLTLRTIRMLFSALFFKLKCFFFREAAWTASQSLPYVFDVFFDSCRAQDEKLIWTGRAYAIRIHGVSRFTTTQVVITSSAVHFLFRRWFRIQDYSLPLDQLVQQKAYSGFLLSRWLLKTRKGDLVLYLCQPMAKTLPPNLPQKVDLDDKPR